MFSVVEIRGFQPGFAERGREYERIALPFEFKIFFAVVAVINFRLFNARAEAVRLIHIPYAHISEPHHTAEIKRDIHVFIHVARRKPHTFEIYAARLIHAAVAAHISAFHGVLRIPYISARFRKRPGLNKFTVIHNFLP